MMILEKMLLNNKLTNRSGILFFLLMVILPFVAGLVYSVLYFLGLTGVLSEGFTFKNIFAVLGSGEVFLTFGYSFYIAATSICISLIISIPSLIMFNKAIINGRKSFFVYLPLSMPAIVTAFISFQLLGKTGLISRFLYNFHIINNLQQFPEFTNVRFGVGIILTHVLMAVPFLLIFFSNLFVSENLAGLSQIANSLGAGYKQVLCRVTLPILLKQGLTTILLYFIFILGSYEIPLILGRQSPQMISVLIVRKMQRFNLLDIPEGYFLSFIYCLFIIIVLFIFLNPKKISRA